MSDVWKRIEEDNTGIPIQLAVDPDGIAVFLSREVWQNHILQNHPEMAALKDLIMLAIATPVAREIESQQVIRSYADVPADRLASKSKLQVRVVVKYVRPPERDNELTGLVSSAYLVRWKAK